MPAQTKSNASRVNIAIVGLGFGAEFIPIFQRHPQANMYAICQRTQKKLDAIGDAFKIGVRYDDYAALLKDPNVDAVHINTAIPDHAWMTLAALKAGKHVACTVPMATSIEDCKKIVDCGEEIETEIHDDGDGGLCARISLHQGTARQGEARENPVPPGEPPAGHGRLAELLAGASADVVCDALRGPDARAGGPAGGIRSCFGSGTIRKELIKYHQSPFAVETAHIKFANSDLTARIIRSLFDVARQYRESIDVYGTKRSFEWTLIEHENARAAHREAARAEDPEAGRSPRLRETPAQGDPSVHHQGGLRPR